MEFSRQECWSGLHFLLQRIFLIQGSNPGLLHCRRILYHKVSGPLLSCCKASAPNQYPYCPCPHSPSLHTHTHPHTPTHTAIHTWLSMVFPPGSSPAKELSCQPAEDHSWGMRYGAYRTSPSGASGGFRTYFNSQWAPRTPCPQLRFLPCRTM